MNYREKHSHKWAKILKESKRRAQLVNELHSSGKAGEAKNEFQLLYGGDFRDPSPEKLFPGLKIMAPYWKAVESEMECRFNCMLEFAGDLKKIADEKEFHDNTDRFYRLFLDDARALIERDKLIDYARVQKYFDGGIRTMHLPEDWPQVLKPMRDRFEANLAKPVDAGLLDEWLTFCVRGVMAYDYSLIRQALFVSTVLQRHGEKALSDVFDKSREEFGWRVSRLFFVDVLPRAAIEGADLMRMGLYSMFCDQDLVREGAASSMGGDAPTKPQIKITKFLNCQEYSVFATVAEHLKLPLRKIGVGICVYCEEHARKNASLFTPPTMKPDLKMEKTLGLEGDMCVCKTVLNPGDDMERFMQAQDKVFYYEENK